MARKLLAILLFLLSLYSSFSCRTAYPLDYSAAGPIHRTRITQGWCGNLAVSTKLGYLSQHHCDYVVETVPYGHDGCELELSSHRLEEKMGKGYTCAATHVHSNIFGSEGLDEYTLILDTDGHYISTQPADGEIKLAN